MKIKYHLSDKGPAECTANIQECPLGGEHFSSFEEAKVVYEVQQKGKLFPKASNKKIILSLTPAAKKVISKLTNEGIQSLVVGGSVRDQMLGIASKDVDLELYGARPDGTSLEFSDIKKLYPRKEGFSVDEAGASFSVLKIRIDKEDFDLALPRTEMSTGDSHTEYEVQHDSTMSFEEASYRRDFTINAMGWNPNTGELIDPHNGAKDLRSQTLRHVSGAFSDDPLRAMRAVNFASRFGFKVAPETRELCKKLAPTYPSLARERVEEEFNKLFNKGKYCGLGLTTLHDIGWADKMPGFKNCSLKELQRYGDKIDKVTPGMGRKAALTKIMIDEKKGNDIHTFIESSSSGRTFILTSHSLMDSIDKNDKGDIVENHRKLKQKNPHLKNSHIKQIITATGRDASILDSLPEKPKESVVTGKLLIDKGFKPGPEMGKIIKKAQRIQDNESIYDFDKLLQRSLTE